LALLLADKAKTFGVLRLKPVAASNSFPSPKRMALSASVKSVVREHAEQKQSQRSTALLMIAEWAVALELEQIDRAEMLRRLVLAHISQHCVMAKIVCK
jgi:hypothetical protein